MVSKPYGSILMCGDFCRLNEYIIDDKFPLPVIEFLLADLGSGNKFFSKIDFKTVYQ